MIGYDLTTYRQVHKLCQRCGEYAPVIYQYLLDIDYLMRDGCRFQLDDRKLVATKTGTTFMGVMDLTDWPQLLINELIDFILPVLI